MVRPTKGCVLQPRLSRSLLSQHRSRLEPDLPGDNVRVLAAEFERYDRTDVAKHSIDKGRRCLGQILMRKYRP